jgi:hypothetical protein
MRKLKALLIATITLLAIVTPSALSQRTSVSRQFRVYDNGGKPDLVVDPQRFVSQMEIIDRNFDKDPCALEEGVIGGPGYRRVLRFDTVVMNSGDADLIVGDRSDPNNPYAEWFEFAPCHGHFHIRDFSGHKQGFCMEDSFKYDGGKSNGYDCGFQGISSGWGDWYYKQLTGQWIDITGVPEGDYIVRVSINTAGTFDEGTNRYGNTVETQIHIPDPRNKVAIDDSAAIIDK